MTTKQLLLILSASLNIIAVFIIMEQRQAMYTSAELIADMRYKIIKPCTLVGPEMGVTQLNCRDFLDTE